MTIRLHCDRCGLVYMASRNKEDIMGIDLFVYRYEEDYSGLRKTQQDSIVFTKDAMLCKQCREGLRRLVAEYMTETNP